MSDPCRLRKIVSNCIQPLSLAAFLFLAVGLVGCKAHGATDTLSVAKARSLPESKPTPTETNSERSCHQFVQDFYNWYFDHLDARPGSESGAFSSDEVLRSRPQLLSPQLLKLLKEDAAAQARNPDYIVGLDADPFLNAQDWDGKYTVKKVTVKENHCRAEVWGTDAGVQKDVVEPELESNGSTWVFTNFHDSADLDPQDRENLISQLILLRDQRNASKR